LLKCNCQSQWLQTVESILDNSGMSNIWHTQTFPNVMGTISWKLQQGALVQIIQILSHN